MDNALKKGLGFGLSSAVIATLAIIVGMHAGTNLKNTVISAVLVIAFADSLADSLAVYLSESENKNQKRSRVLLTTATAFLSKLIFALSFLVPIFLFDLHLAIWVDVLYGFLVLTFYSYHLAKTKNEGNEAPCAKSAGKGQDSKKYQSTGEKEKCSLSFSSLSLSFPRKL